MDPTQAHVAGAALTVRLTSADVDPVLREVAEATLVEHLGSPLHIDTGPGYLQVQGPGGTGTLCLVIVPRDAGLSSVRLEGAIGGWEGLAAELQGRLLRAVSRRCGPMPADGYCHALGFGRECDRRVGHSGNHLSVRGEPTAWAPDGSTPVRFESRFVVEDLLDRIHTLESMVERARTTARSTAVPSRRPGANRAPGSLAALTLRPPSESRPKASTRGPRRSASGHRKKPGYRAPR